MPEVSVIIPTYNRAGLLAQAIESVLAQSYPSFEIIVVDDGSRDDTNTVVGSYSDPRIRYIYQDNAGLSAARNTGIRAARGKYVALLDADDLFMPEKLAYQVQVLDHQPEVGFVAGGFLYVDADGRPLAERRPWQSHPQLDLMTWLHGCPVVPSAVLLSRAWLARVGGFDSALRRVEDRDLWLRLAYHGCGMAWTPHLTCAYRIHGGQMVRDGQSQKETTLAVLDKFFAQPGLPIELHNERQQAYAAAYLEGAFREYGAGQVIAAKESLTRAIGRQPALMVGEVPPLTYTLISWAADPITGDPVAFAVRVLDNLPASAASLCSCRQRILYAAAIWAIVDASLVGNTELARQHLRNALRCEATFVDDPALMIELFIDRVRSEEAERQIRCVEDFFDNLPSELAGLVSYRSKALARLCMARGFEACADGAAKEAGKALWQGVRRDPSWLRNRGVWSIMLRSLLGHSRQDSARASEGLQ